jgi:hypothetical protein
MNFFRESRRDLTSRTGLCSSRRQRMGAIPSEMGLAELLGEHGLSGILRTSCAISEAGEEGARTYRTSLSGDCL